MLMFLLKLWKRDSLTFILLNFLRVLGLIACILVIAAEAQRMVGDVDASKAPPPATTSLSSIATSNIPSTFASAVPAKASSVLNNLGPKASAIVSHITKRDETPTLTQEECGYKANSTIPDQTGGIVFALASAIFDILLMVLIFVAEASVPFVHGFLEKVVPIFGPDRGLGWLGLIETYMSANVLSRRLSTFGIAAGWLMLITGLLNVLIGIIYGSAAREMRSLKPSNDSPIGKLSSRIRSRKGTENDSISTGNSEKSRPHVINISAPLEAAPPYARQPSMQQKNTQIPVVSRMI